jgi:hypothetical protein
VPGINQGAGTLRTGPGYGGNPHARSALQEAGAVRTRDGAFKERNRHLFSNRLRDIQETPMSGMH